MQDASDGEVSRGHSPSRSNSRSRSPGDDASRIPSPRKGYGSEGSAEAFAAIIGDMERLAPRHGSVRRGAVPRAAREGVRRTARGQAQQQQQQQQQQPVDENIGQGSSNSDNEVAQALEALDDSSVASDENFYDTEK